MMLTLLLFVLFFFQAEDGIRDLVRSRGLGDVYKRQDLSHALQENDAYPFFEQLHGHIVTGPTGTNVNDPVSYTHLTLPTSDLV